MKNLKIAAFLFIFSFINESSAQTIRPHHWLMDEAGYYWNRGYLWHVSPLQRPLTLQQLNSALRKVENSPEAPSLKMLHYVPRRENAETACIWLEAENTFRRDDDRSYLHAVQRAGAGIRLNSTIQIFGNFNLDNRLDADSSYIGERQNGFAAFMEQAYIRAEWKRFTVVFGRDYLVWGPGLDASLHISDYSRPMDHLFISWQNRFLQLSYFTATLDKTKFAVDGEEAEQNRRLSGHRIEVRPWTFFRIGLSETALFGGPDAGADYAFVNPLLLYTGVEQNGPQKANVMASLDMTILLKRCFSIYGSFLLDDFQFENSTADDRGEPAEIGCLAGANWADPFSIRGLDLFAEYTRVTNRTYNGQGGPWEKYLHRNRAIGHFLGNDFERTILGVRYRNSAKLALATRYEHRRRGEGRIEKPFDMPWRDVPPGETYSEPFPTGVIESSDIFQFSCRWQPFPWLRTEVHVAHFSVVNLENQPGADENFWQAGLNVSFELYRSISFP